MIYASLASVSTRYHQRENAIKSIATQVTSVVWHNGDAEGDKMKFKDMRDGYFFPCDDDLLYPEDYTEKMIAKLNEYDNKVIVTCMGRILHSQPIEKYYRNASIEKFSCLNKVEKDIFVHIGGTGVMAFHTDYFRPDYTEFKNGFMSDIWLALQAQKKKIPILVMAHDANWIIQQETSGGIYEAYKDNDLEQVKAVNSINWVIYEARN